MFKIKFQPENPGHSSINFHSFCNEIRKNYRYIQNNKVTKFLDSVFESSKKRQIVINEGTLYYRAQLDHDWGLNVIEDYNGDKIEYIGDTPIAYPKERMKPIPNKGKEGRANPKGISYLYLADNKKTAISEVRPWIQSNISVGEFRLNKALSIIDCSLSFYEEDHTPSWESLVWPEIDKAFSEPITLSDESADYAPTQIISEFFKFKGFDGVAYKSSITIDGNNVVLFNPKVADLITCSIYEVESVDIKFKSIGGYYSTKKYKEYYENT
jgi:RES domain-containing protein